MAANEAKEQQGAPAPTPEEDRDNRSALKLPALVGLGLFLLGFIISYLWLPATPASPPVAEHLPLAAKTDTSAPPDSPQAFAATAVADLKRADTFLEQSRWDMALGLYQQISEEKTRRSDLVDWKIGLCLEGLGRWNRALAVYRSISSHGQPRVADVALLGQARTLIRLGEPAESKLLLYSVLLRSSSADPGILPDARYLLALALAHEALPRAAGQPLELKIVRPPLGPWKARNIPDTDKPAPAQNRNADVPKFVVAAQDSFPPEQKLVTASLEQAPVKDIVDDLGKLVGLRIDWTPRALQLVAGRTTRLNLANCPLIDVVQGIAEPLQLVCMVEEKTLRIAEVDEAGKGVLAGHRLAAAQRALRNAVLAYPGQWWTAAACFELAGLEEARGNLPQALSWNDRLLREWPRSPLVSAAHYNLGILYARQENSALAVRAFYRVVDRSPGHELAPLALLHIGRLHVKQREFRQALVPLNRSVAIGGGSEALPAATITLAAAYLALDKTKDANAILFAHRDQLADSPYRPSAAFVDAYALYRAAMARKETRREPAGLLTALLSVRNEKVLDVFGQYLAGKAFRDLGMWNEVVKKYEKIVTPSANPLIREMTLHLAEAYYMLKKLDRAVPLLNSLAERHKDTWAAAARFQLAAIALQQDRPHDCLQRSLRILEEQLPVERDALLHLLGEAYERIGEHDKAARCFAGQTPNQL